MIAATLIKLEASSMNSLVKPWMPVWIPYNDRINVAQNISFARNIYVKNTPSQQSKGLSWTEGRALLGRANISKWEADVSPTARNRNVNARLVCSGTSEDRNKFSRILQENINTFHDKAQVWKENLQTWPEPSKLCHVIYGANKILDFDLISDVLSVV